MRKMKAVQNVLKEGYRIATLQLFEAEFFLAQCFKKSHSKPKTATGRFAFVSF